MELFRILGNEAMVIVDEAQIAHEVRGCFGLREVTHSLKPVQEEAKSQKQRHVVRER